MKSTIVSMRNISKLFSVIVVFILVSSVTFAGVSTPTITNYNITGLTIGNQSGTGMFIDYLGSLSFLNGLVIFNATTNAINFSNGFITNGYVNASGFYSNGVLLVTDNTSWNKSYADTLYASANVTSGIQNITVGTGLNGGFITTNGTISLADTSVVSGTYGSATLIPTFTVDAQGRLTSVTNVSIPSASTSTSGLVQLTDSVASTSTTTAVTPNALKTTYDLATGKVGGIGTIGTIAKWNTSGTLVDSILTESGSTLTTNGAHRVTGTLTVDGDFVLSTGNIYLSSATEINGSQLPLLDNAFDLGNSSARWRDLYLSGTLQSGAVPYSLLTGVPTFATQDYVNGNGNWTLDKPSYASIAFVTSYVGGVNNVSLATIQSMISANGNWSADQVNYATLAYVNAINNLSYTQIANNIGNWTLDKSSYSTTAQANGLYYPLNSNPFGYYNASTLPTSTNFYQNITDLQTSNTSTNQRIDVLNSTTQGQYTNISALQSNSNQYYNNITTNQNSIASLVVNVSAQNGYANITNLQTSNASTNQRVDTLNTTAQGQYTNITTAQNSLASLVVNVSAQNGYANITNLQTSNASTNQRVDTLNTTAQGQYTNITTAQNSLASLVVNVSAQNGYTNITTAQNSLASLVTNVSSQNTYSNVSTLQTNATSIVDRINTWQLTVADPTGFYAQTDISLSFNFTSRNFTITPTGANYTYWINGTACTKTQDSVIVTNTSGLHFIYYNSCGNLIEQPTPWGFEGIAQVALLYTTDTNYTLGNEKHDLGMDWKTHRYLHTTAGTRYISGLSATFTDTTFNTSAGVLYDENLDINIVAQSRANVLYRNTSNIWNWVANTTLYYYKNATNMYYDNNGVLTAVGNNDFMAVWIFGTNDERNPIIAVLGQRTDGTLANARANNLIESMSFANLPFAEYKILYRVIIKNDATPYEETQDLRSVSNLPSGTYIATAHSTLTGLSYDASGHTGFASSTDVANIYTNTSQLQTSLNSLVVNVTSQNTYANVTALQSSSNQYYNNITTNQNSIASLVVNVSSQNGYNNITNLQTSNTSAWINLAGAYSNISTLQSRVNQQVNTNSNVNFNTVTALGYTATGRGYGTSGGGISLIDLNSQAYLILGTQDNLGTSNSRILYLNTQNATRSLNITGNASISGVNTGDQDLSSYATLTYVNSINNLSYSQIVANIGNWTSDKVNYATLAYVNAINNLSYSQIASNIGNWTLDKSSYSTTAQANGLYAPIGIYANVTNLQTSNTSAWINLAGAYTNITTAQSSLASLVVNVSAQNGYGNITNLQTDRTQLNVSKFNVTGGNITGNFTAPGVNIYGNMTIGDSVGQILFGNGGGYSWNSTDSCLVSPPNSTNSRQILCVTKPTG